MMNTEEAYYMQEADKLMCTLSNWNIDNRALAYSGEGTAWDAIELAASKCLELAGFDLQQIEQMMELHYECGENFDYCAKYLEFI